MLLGWYSVVCTLSCGCLTVGILVAKICNGQSQGKCYIHPYKVERSNGTTLGTQMKAIARWIVSKNIKE